MNAKSLGLVVHDKTRKNTQRGSRTTHSEAQRCTEIHEESEVFAMKAPKRFLSLLTAAVTVATMLPAYLTEWKIPVPAEAAGDPGANLTIDFNYETDKGVTSPEQSLASIGAESNFTDGKISKEQMQTYYDPAAPVGDRLLSYRFAGRCTGHNTAF